MSDFGLLMTSILVMRQKVASNLPRQLLVQHENYLFKADSRHLPSSAITLQVTPPEFTQFDDTSSTTVFSPNRINKIILSNVLAKAVSKKLLGDLEQKLSASILTAQKEVIADAGSNSLMAAVNRRRSANNFPRLEFGDSGISVRVMQKLLASNGYNVQVDGFFGALPEAAVKAFQNRRNLVVDGIVGRNTWRELTR